MAIIHVRTMVDFTVDTEAYVKARALEDIGDAGPTADQHIDIAHEFLTIEKEELIERWAWHCIELTDEHVMISDQPFPSLFIDPSEG